MHDSSPSNRIESIYHYLPLSDLIATAGQPTVEQFADIHHAGYRVVVNLALPTSSNALADEQDLVESQGMSYIHIPVEWENPTLEDFEQFVAVMQAHQDKKVFVHCAANMRVSAFMYLYQRLYRGVSNAQATQDLHHIWQPNQVWQQFIEQILT